MLSPGGFLLGSKSSHAKSTLGLYLGGVTTQSLSSLDIIHLLQASSLANLVNIIHPRIKFPNFRPR